MRNVGMMKEIVERRLRDVIVRQCLLIIIGVMSLAIMKVAIMMDRIVPCILDVSVTRISWEMEFVMKTAIQKTVPTTLTTADSQFQDVHASPSNSVMVTATTNAQLKNAI